MRPTDDHYYRHLSRNIQITVVVVSFLPLLLVTGLILYEFQISYGEKVLEHLRTLVTMHRDNIDDYLSERLEDVRFLAGGYAYEELRDEAFLASRLELLRQEHGPAISDLGVVDGDGQQVAYAGPYKLERAVYTRADWFERAKHSQYFISDVFLGLRGFPHFILTVRREEADGRPWILRATVEFQDFNDRVENIRVGETGLAFILNRQGQLQTRTSLDVLSYADQYRAIMDRSDYEGDRVHSDIVESDTFGVRLLYVAAFLKEGQWALIYQQHAKDAFADLHRAHWIGFVVFILGGLLIIGMAFILSHRMVARIQAADEEMKLMNRQMIERGKLASLGEMAAGIAHEINNPVAIMVEEAGWIEDLLEDEDLREAENIEEFQRALSQIQKQGLRCRDITQKLLSFARSSSGRTELLDVNPLVEELLGLFAQQARYGNVSLVSKPATDPPVVRASQTEIQQVLFNLIGNALDALTEVGGGRITVATETGDGMVLIRVSDDGPGIPAEDRQRIFEPFFTTKPVGKGTGLGLAICYGIATKLGGHIELKASEQGGAEFRVELPPAGPVPKRPGAGQNPEK
jgi:two-component system NtrC family sensor kinase